MAPVNVASGAPIDPRFTDDIAHGQGRLGRPDTPEHLLPKEVSGDIFTKVAENSSLLSLG
ncbi:hypothetical protein [Pseudonocardia sp. ICBG601]|uniref:hypothetical protein n=1 Tax=Pseudonocardia sp. ICBG601 TaxID=2846759 RepID=UPI001CF67D96|nr:hypothetical protein [Pseudonocardia sp. ICBG601]